MVEVKHRRNGRRVAQTVRNAPPEAAFLRAQRERAAALEAEQHRRIDALRTRLERFALERARMFGSSVSMRQIAIRQKQRAVVARLRAGTPVPKPARLSQDGQETIHYDHEGTRNEEVW